MPLIKRFTIYLSLIALCTSSLVLADEDGRNKCVRQLVRSAQTSEVFSASSSYPASGPSGRIVVRARDNLYVAYAEDYPGHYAMGTLRGDRLYLDMQMKTWFNGQWRRSEGFSGFDQLQKILVHFGDRARVVVGTWDVEHVGRWKGWFTEQGEGPENTLVFRNYLKWIKEREGRREAVLIPSKKIVDGFAFQLTENLEIFNKAIANGDSKNSAARSTWTGQTLQRLGFTRVRVSRAIQQGNGGMYTYVRVYFYRSKH